MALRNSAPNLLDGLSIGLGLVVAGIPLVVPTHLSYVTGELMIVVGIVWIFAYSAYRWSGWAANLARGEVEPATVDNRGGAYVGRDNAGTQQIIHGDVHIHQAPNTRPAFPAPPKPKPPRRAQNQDVRDYSSPNLARHTLHPVEENDQFKSRILLRESARRLFEVVEGSPFGTYLKGIGDESDIFTFLTTAFCQYAALYGCTPPSRIARRLDAERVKHLWWIPGTESLGDITRNVIYQNVGIMPDDFEKLSQEMKGWTEEQIQTGL